VFHAPFNYSVALGALFPAQYRAKLLQKYLLGCMKKLCMHGCDMGGSTV